MADSDFHLETHSVRVEVILRGGRVLTGLMFLRPAAGRHLGAETVEDRLNEPNPFFPLVSESESRAALLVCKAQVACVKADKPTDDRSRAARAAASEIAVTVEISGYDTLSGNVYVALPSGRSRALDWLNAQGAFVPLVVDSHVLYIQRDAIQTVHDHHPSVTVPPVAGESS